MCQRLSAEREKRIIRDLRGRWEIWAWKEDERAAQPAMEMGRLHWREREREMRDLTLSEITLFHIKLKNTYIATAGSVVWHWFKPRSNRPMFVWAIFCRMPTGSSLVLISSWFQQLVPVNYGQFGQFLQIADSTAWLLYSTTQIRKDINFLRDIYYNKKAFPDYLWYWWCSDQYL